MTPYLDLLRHVRDHGTEKSDRTGTGTKSVFGYQLRFDLSAGFPAVTTKKLHWKSVVHELLWFLMGDSNARYLQENGVRIWNEWADEDGELGPIYGVQWRSWPKADGSTVDQVAEAIRMLRETPDSRRIIVNAWNVSELDRMALQPCHTMFQFDVADGKLSCQLYQRSADIFLGVPFNIASYALLTHMVAQVTGLEVGDFVHTFGDAHIYLNHAEQVDTQLAREPLPAPSLWLDPSIEDIDAFRFEHIELRGYESHPAIKAPVAVRRAVEISLIVATDRNGIIGKNGDLPWHLPADLRHFKKTTMGKPLVMGRRTHESIGRALPGRRNVVLTRSLDWQPAEGCERATSLDDALALLDGEPEIMIIGGEAIYFAFLPVATRLYLTAVDIEVEGGDARFPEIDADAWREVARKDRERDDANPLAMSFRVLERRETEK